VLLGNLAFVAPALLLVSISSCPVALAGAGSSRSIVALWLDFADLAWAREAAVGTSGRGESGTSKVDDDAMLPSALNATIRSWNLQRHMVVD
jgi:hypothetical protein